MLQPHLESCHFDFWLILGSVSNNRDTSGWKGSRSEFFKGSKQRQLHQNKTEKQHKGKASKMRSRNGLERSKTRENRGRDFTQKGVGKKRTQTEGEQSEERGGERCRWKGEQEWEETIMGAAEQNEGTGGQRGTMSSAVAPAGVRQVHLMTHLSVWLTQTL